MVVAVVLVVNRTTTTHIPTGPNSVSVGAGGDGGVAGISIPPTEEVEEHFLIFWNSINFLKVVVVVDRIIHMQKLMVDLVVEQEKHRSTGGNGNPGPNFPFIILLEQHKDTLVVKTR